MSLRGTMAAGVLLLGLVLPAAAQTTPQWKFKEGDKFFIETVNDTKRTVTVGNKKTTSGDTFTTVSEFVVKKADAGSYTLEQVITDVKAKSEKPDDATDYIPTRFANQLRGAKFRFTIDAAGNVGKSLEGYEDLVKALGGGDEATEKAVRAQYPEDMFRADLNGIFVPLPDSPQGRGATWKRPESFTMQWGKLTGEATYTYDGKDADGDRIRVNRTWSYELSKESPAAAAIKDGSFKVDEATASIVADPAGGKPIRDVQTTHLTGTLTVTDAATNKDTKVSIDQTTTRTLKRLDEYPPKK
jgi:hypothetical protein